VAFHSRMTVYQEIYQTRLVPLFYHAEFETARQIVLACYEGGMRLIEFTNRGNFALRVFSALRKYFSVEYPDLMLGIGSVVDASTASHFIAHGADFVVTPLLNPEIIEVCNRQKIGCIPGCATLSEISHAESLGSEIVKVFPANAAGGPDFVKAILAPSPWTSVMVTGGVKAQQDNIHQWFSAGVTAVGLGSQLIRKESVQSGDLSAITTTIQQVITWINEASE
jgi:2-dehydro-3-deoxyphosphogluconate aldolase/(4S)-4-hydroxy-2-oxoglutarate aldolase